MQKELSPETVRLFTMFYAGVGGPAPHILPNLTGLSWKGAPLTWTIPPSPEDIPEGAPSVVYRFKNPPVLMSGTTLLGVINSGVLVYPRSAPNVIYTVSPEVYTKNKIVLRCFPVDELEPISEELVGKDYGYTTELHTSLQSPIMFEINASYEPGTVSVLMPPEFKDMGSFLCFITDESMANYFLIEVDTEKGTVTTMPQEWFKKIPHEDGYEWPMNAVRDPESKKIYGEVMRMAVFELSPDGQEFLRWVGA